MTPSTTTPRLAATLMVIIVALSLCGMARPAQARTYRIATVAWMGWSPLHVAQAKGFWARRGVRVEVVNYDDPIVILEAIKAGRIDFAMDMVGSLVGVYMQGTPVVALAETNWSHGGDKILIHKGRRMEQFLGQPVGVFLNLPSCLYFLGQYLKTQSLKLTQFRMVEMGPENLSAQFVAGRLPVIVNYEPWVNQALAGAPCTVLATSADYPGCIPECLWGYRKSLGGVPRADIVAIIQGWMDAAAWVNDPSHWPEFQNILNQSTFKAHAPYSELQLANMLKNVRIHTSQQLRERNRDGGGLFAYLSDLRDFLRENRMLAKDFQPRDIIDNSYVMEALGPKN